MPKTFIYSVLAVILIFVLIFALNQSSTNSNTDHNGQYSQSSSFLSQNQVSDSTVEKTYQIQNSKPTQNFTNQKHQQVWDYFVSLIPAKYTTQITVLEIIDQKENLVIANLVNLENQPNNWKLKISLDKVYLNNQFNPELLKYTYVHELGHLLTLNSQELDLDYAYLKLKGKDFQDNFQQKEASCQPNYYLQEGCSKTNSTINLFWQKFWKPVWAEYLEIQKTSDNKQFNEKSSNFCKKYQDQFVSQTACQNPEEDIAETFAYFILKKEPISETTKKKVEFIESFEQLKLLKNEIV